MPGSVTISASIGAGVSVSDEVIDNVGVLTIDMNRQVATVDNNDYDITGVTTITATVHSPSNIAFAIS